MSGTQINHDTYQMIFDSGTTGMTACDLIMSMPCKNIRSIQFDIDALLADGLVVDCGVRRNGHVGRDLRVLVAACNVEEPSMPDGDYEQDLIDGFNLKYR